ncbi:MAG: alanyl-tRNA editing protein [Dehalococcoidia bacterium]|nr:alanyl-tRNA editing protein [Dehalococcoidia bacterium]
MTDLLYQHDAYVRAFDATVVAVTDDGVVLDRTAFYPGGGGQLPDRGTLRADDRVWRVTGFRRDGDQLVHVLDAPPPPVGTAVRGDLDWPFRLRMMRTHTAMHILCGVIWQEFGAQVTGGQMYEDRARMDFSLDDLSAERVQQIERRVNEEIANARPVRVAFLPREEAIAIPDLVRTKVNLVPAEIPTIRIVDIAGLDRQADGGTHVANTREVGRFRIVGTQNKGKINKRIEIVVED